MYNFKCPKRAPISLKKNKVIDDVTDTYNFSLELIRQAKKIQKESKLSD